jgi:hypothetical protein
VSTYLQRLAARATGTLPYAAEPRARSHFEPTTLPRASDAGVAHPPGPDLAKPVDQDGEATPTEAPVESVVATVARPHRASPAAPGGPTAAARGGREPALHPELRGRRTAYVERDDGVGGRSESPEGDPLTERAAPASERPMQSPSSRRARRAPVRDPGGDVPPSSPGSPEHADDRSATVGTAQPSAPRTEGLEPAESVRHEIPASLDWSVDEPADRSGLDRAAADTSPRPVAARDTSPAPTWSATPFHHREDRVTGAGPGPAAPGEPSVTVHIGRIVVRPDPARATAARRSPTPASLLPPLADSLREKGQR